MYGDKDKPIRHSTSPHTWQRSHLLGTWNPRIYRTREEKNTHFLHNPRHQSHCDEPEFTKMSDAASTEEICCWWVWWFVKKGITVCTLEDMQYIYSVSVNSCCDCPISCQFTEFRIKRILGLTLRTDHSTSQWKMWNGRNLNLEAMTLGGNNINFIGCKGVNIR